MPRPLTGGVWTILHLVAKLGVRRNTILVPAFANRPFEAYAVLSAAICIGYSRL
jgi:hypothetical protein